MRVMHARREDGFTMVEIMITVGIIAILSVIAVPIYLNQRKAATDASVRSDIEGAVTQIETWLVGQPAGNAPVLNNFTAERPVDAAAPTVKWTASGATIPNGTLLGSIKVSEGSTLTVTGGAGGSYTVVGKNPDGDIAATSGGIIFSAEQGKFTN